jgi:hypothetical protein
MNFERARKVADAVLYEGYVLYPYRASARKNQMRWQFGVLAPKAWCDAGGCEHSFSRTECLLEGGADAKLHGKVRFLQLQRRTIEEAPGVAVPSLEVGGELFTSWDEGLEREIEFAGNVRFQLPGAREVQAFPGSAARLVRERWPLAGEIRVSIERSGSGLARVRVEVENLTDVTDPSISRDEALRSSFTGAHVLLAAENGEFISLLDPPEQAREAAASCKNVRVWPVLIERDLVLSSPIILYDHPQVAKESPGDLYDATEIDEILTLRTQTLTDEEKREARATDPRAAAILDRVDHLPAEMLEKLHGAIRSVEPSAQPFWDPGADASVSPETDSVEIAGVPVAKGSVVRLHPGRHADAQDMFLEGQLGVVQGVYLDVEDRRYLAVTLRDDPAADLHLWHGRFLYFFPEEVEPAQ